MIIDMNEKEQIKMGIGLVCLHAILMNPKAHGLDMINTNGNNIKEAHNKAEIYSEATMQYLEKKYGNKNR